MRLILDKEVQYHSKPELCWAEADWKDGQANKDLDEHAKVKVGKLLRLWQCLCQRCGMKDIVGHGSYARKKRWHFFNSPIPIFDSTSGLCIFLPTSRSDLLNSFCRYVLQGSRWTKKVLTWKIYKYSRQTSLDKREVGLRIFLKWLFLNTGEPCSERIFPVVAAAHQESWFQRGARI